MITDRRVLDRQLQSAMRQFEQTLGVVENIDKTSRQLREALEGGKTIIVTTLQKFPVIATEIGELPGRRFALIVDEAHSSQSGESTKDLKAVLAARSLEEAESEEADAQTPEEELDTRSSRRWRSASTSPTSQPSHSPRRQSPRRWSSLERSNLTDRSRPSISTACGRR